MLGVDSMNNNLLLTDIDDIDMIIAEQQLDIIMLGNAEWVRDK